MEIMIKTAQILAFGLMFSITYFLMWVYYKFNENIKAFITLNFLMLYMIIAIDLSPLNGFLFSSICAFCSYLFLKKKADKFKSDYLKARQEEAIRRYKRNRDLNSPR